MKKQTALIFSHVHWDIEWYLPLHSFPLWMIKILDRLIDPVAKQRGFKVFVLDGQVAPVDHYLAVYPERAPLIRRLVRSGKLALGPFYTQFDEWLTGPEAIVRNALYGDRRARAFGRVMQAGYLPDNFGHPRQMPQILAGFGIDSLIFMRGMPEPPPGVEDQFYWVGLDGTRTLALHMRHTYCALHSPGSRRGGFGAPVFRSLAYGDYIQTPESLHAAARDTDLDEGVKTLIDRARLVGATCPTGIIPLPNGFDSAPAQETIAELIARANAVQAEFRFVHGDCADLVRAVRRRAAALPAFDGELWGGQFQLILTGTLATRTYLKQANFIAESLLERYAEPLSAMAALEGAPWPARQLEEAWRELFHNQAHDGIHGSSIDSAHEAMVQRYHAARQIAVGLSHDALAVLAMRLASQKRPTGGDRILAYRPAASAAGTPVVDTWLHGFDPARQHVTDARNRPLPVQNIPNPWAGEPSRPRTSQAGAWPDGNPTHVLIAGPIPAGGLATWTVREGPAPAPPPMGRQRERQIENAFLRIAFKRGAFEILDKATGHTYRGLGVIEDEADRGDAWDFSPPWQSHPLIVSTDFPATCRLVEDGPVRATLEAVVEMRIPRRLDGERRSRERVVMPITLRVALLRDARRADLTVSFDHTVQDHRLRLRVPTAIPGDTIKTQSHFGLLVRPIRHPDEAKTGWRQMPPATFPFREWVAMDDGRRGLAVAARGLHEAETRRGKSGVDLFITLLRAFGRMGRYNLKSRAHATSPAIPTPGAQCPGPQYFEFSFLPYDGVTRNRRAPFLPEAETFLYPPTAHQVDPRHWLVDAAIPRSGRKPSGMQPPFVIEPANLRFSAFKQAADGDGWILRLWENEGRRTQARVALAPAFKHVAQVGLDERNPIPLRRTRQGITLTVEPYRIVTLKLAGNGPD